ncbi:S41 family peptidase [Maribacter aurantiacus]|uniref:Carboxyl-terminal protease n=1 Tax=Maribacter aurantiacus TaxID=1882343 RepID=A0A5R8M3F4_9FLAO|nr:S41 family peptidase [Maribacter aurantiacus]TLF44065.1 carboxyl-terminal protease [Maribacter aurantiacus]
MSIKSLLPLVFVLAVFSCSKDDELSVPKTVDPLPSSNVPVQNFMWKAMNFWYFWQADVPDLADNRFQDSESYTEFLQSVEEPGAFFDSKLLYIEDRFSFYNSDYRELTNSLAGISRSNGLEFGLVRKANSEEVFGYVRYIIPNSDAATKDIERGDLFTGVNGTTLTINNFQNLLFGANNTYVLNMADFSNGDVIQNEREVSLTKEEALAENPVFISKSFEVNGITIGYLMYNQFTNEYDDDLYDAVLGLKNLGITELVVDLRYNPGGSVNTTRILASMIYDTNTDNLFIRKRYNDKIQDQLSESQLEVYFTDRVGSKTIEPLGLNKLYVLTSASSASASELLINSLEPYIDVVIIGDVTRGKNEFSTTLVDDRENSYLYTPSRVNKINPDNQWAIQPLLGRNENADGFFDYTDGLVPDIQLKEDYGNLGILGDLNEPLLARAIQEITGATGKRDFTVENPIEIFSSSKMYGLFKDKMIDDTLYELDLSLN